MSGTTVNLDLTWPSNGGDVGTWDTPVNANWQALDAKVGGNTAINVTSVSGTVNLSQAQCNANTFTFTGTLGAAVTYAIPSGIGGTWSMFNNSTGAHTITIKSLTGAGTTVVLAQGFSTDVICDQTNVGIAMTAPSSAAGSTTQVQFNSSGLLAGSANFVWNGTTLAVTGKLALNGASSGAFTLQVPAAAGSTTYTLPATPGSAGQFLTELDGAGTLGWTGATGGVTSFSAGSTGLTPSTSTGGAIILAGTLATGFGGTGLTAFTSGGAVYATSASVLTTGTLPVSGGGTGLATTPAKGALDIGTGAGFARATLTAGAGITITNGTGTITVAASNAGTVTSVQAAGGTTGLTFSGGPITTSGTLTLGGTLAVVSGGTGAGTGAGALSNLGAGTAATQNTGTSGANVPLLNANLTWSGTQTYSTTSTFNGTATFNAQMNVAAGLVGTSNAQTTPAVVTFSATAMSLNCDASNVFTTTFTANVTVAPTMSSPNDGQTINWFITQDGTGSRTMTWPTSFKWVNGSAGVLSTAANSVDMLVATYRSGTSSWYTSLLKGFA